MPAKKIKRKPAPKTVRRTLSPKAGANMLSIWYFVGLMLTVLGVIVTVTGVYYIFRPQHETRLAELNPSLWWGGVIFVAGLIFLIPSWRRYKAGK